MVGFSRLIPSIAGGFVVAGVVATAVLFFNDRAPVPPPHEVVAPPAARSIPADVRASIEGVKTEEARSALHRVYGAVDYKPLWSGGRDARRRTAALDEFLNDLHEQDISPRSANTARAALRAAQHDPAADVRMTVETLALMRGARHGFAAAKDLGDWTIAPETSDPAGELAAGVANGTLSQVFTGLSPSHRPYRALLAGLAHYRTLAAAGGWPQVPGESEVTPDDPRFDLVRLRLVAEDYLPNRSNVTSQDVLDAVKAFQRRNGLEPDGRIGRGTLAAMNVPAATRVDQIAANLERWRHMRRELPDSYLMANAADQSVAVIRDGKEDFVVRTIVGDLRHATPMLAARLNAVTFNPPWEIPPSISRKEIIPKLKDNPYYLEDNDIIIVDGTTDDPHGLLVDWERSKNLRLRQRPGSHNSLGHVKFEMANPYNIYLHDTPSRGLFAKQDRFFSHGCVRVDQPRALASYLLGGMNPEEIDGMIATGETRTVRLEKPLDVYVMYWTAFVDESGKVHFRRDAYKRDETTIAALDRAGVRPMRDAQVARAEN